MAWGSGFARVIRRLEAWVAHFRAVCEVKFSSYEASWAFRGFFYTENPSRYEL